MSQTLTLSEFLENTGAKLRFYDLGRRVSRIARDDFLAFERTEQAYPYPMQQKAWFAVVQQRAQDLATPVIWFLRFDLDEQAKLVQATRDYFIHRFVELANDKPDAENLGKALDDNPYVFKPRDDKMANFHAMLNCDLGQPPSQYYAHAQQYFAGDLGWEQWNFLGYQGIADLAARLDQDDNAGQLASAVPQLPDEPLAALGQCLENHALPQALADALLARLQALLTDKASAAMIAALLRALALAPDQSRKQAIELALNADCAGDPEVLAAIGGRAWESLQDEATARLYLETLADESVAQEIFNHCMADLLRIPGLQQPLLGVLRAPDRSEALARAFQAMLG